MSYKQQGNSCGAWCAAHRVQIASGAVVAESAFIALAQQIYAEVKFRHGEAPPPFVAAGWSDPWRIMDRLAFHKIPYNRLQVEPAARAARADLFSLVEGAPTRRLRDIGYSTLGKLPGKYAIALFEQLFGLGGLHYMLVRASGGAWDLYDPNNDRLDWLPQGGPIVCGKTYGGVGGRYMYLGAYIAC